MPSPRKESNMDHQFCSRNANLAPRKAIPPRCLGLENYFWIATCRRAREVDSSFDAKPSSILIS